MFAPSHGLPTGLGMDSKASYDHREDDLQWFLCKKNEHFMFFWAQVSRAAAELVTSVSVHSCGRQTRFALIWAILFCFV